jgi:hypothetical protein
LLSRTLLMGRSVQAFLTNHGRALSEVEPVLFFSDPGIHVELVRPTVRLVMADAVDRFVAGLVQSRILLNQEEIRSSCWQERVMSSRCRCPQVEEDAFSFSDPASPASHRTWNGIPWASKASFSHHPAPFYKPAVDDLGVIIFINIILLAALVLFLVFNA